MGLYLGIEANISGVVIKKIGEQDEDLYKRQTMSRHTGRK